MTPWSFTFTCIDRRPDGESLIDFPTTLLEWGLMDDDFAQSPEIRLSDAERDLVINQLRIATNEGRISLLEFEERAGLVYAARFASEITEVTADLPEVDAVEATTIGGGLTSPDRGLQRKSRRWLIQVMGGVERVGRWNPGRTNNVFTLMGGQLIDLSDVAVEQVEINAFTMMGGLTVIVPRGAEVDAGGLMFMGGSGIDVVPPTKPPTMTVRIRYGGLMGGVEVIHPDEHR